MEKKSLFFALLILGTAFWGISFPVTKMAVGHVSSSTFLFYRFLGATIVLSLLFLKQVKRTSIRSVRTGVQLAIPLVLGIHFQTLGLKHTSASQCAFVAGICVVMIPVIKALFYRSVISLKIWLAAIISMAGLFIISIKGSFTLNIGDLYTIIGALGFAIYLIYVERKTDAQSVLSTIVPMFGTCTIISFCISLADSTANWVPADNAFWMGIFYCALFSTAFMYTVSNIAQQYISAEKVAIIYLFEPVFASIFAFLILDEDLSWRLLVGGSLIFAATLISELKFRKPDPMEVSPKQAV